MLFLHHCRKLALFVILLAFDISNAHKSFILNDSIPEFYKEKDISRENSKWLTEGDIPSRLGRSDLPHPILFWDDAVFRYEYSPEVNANMRKLVRRSMQDWADGTCIKFYQASSGERIKIQSNANEGCYSTIGKPMESEQHILNLEPNECARIGLVTHELGHSLGLLHEHNRPDRDDYIQIINEEVQDDMTGNFRKFNCTFFGVDYDYLSVMHYRSTAFARRNGTNTLITKDWAYTYLSGRRHRISFGDYKKVNVMYNCNDRNNCPKDLDCGSNGGYVGPKCLCVCPPGSSGTNCQITTNTKHPLLCGGKYTSEEFIESPNYKGTRTMEEYCFWQFKAPKGKRVSVKILQFSFVWRHNGRCVYEWVEFRQGSDPIGEFKCGEDFKAGDTVNSTGEVFSILINPYGPFGIYGKGLKAQVTFI